MNLKELVWTKDLSLEDKLNQIDLKILELETSITNRKELTLDIYYDFSDNLESISNPNTKWKQLRMAKKVIRLTNRWDRKYTIDINRKLNGDIFKMAFSDQTRTSKRFLCDNGINYFAHDTYQVKTMIIWAYKLLKNNLISDISYNKFMELLETITNKEENKGENYEQRI